MILQYQSLNAPTDHAKRATTLKNVKSKVTRLHSHQQQRILLDNGDSDGLIGDEVFLHHRITALKRKKARTVTQIQNEERIIQTTSTAILRTFTDHLRRKYDHIPSFAESTLETLDYALKKLPPIDANILEEPITLEELRAAVTTGKARKAPWCDGINHEFFKTTWKERKHDLLNIMNTMYSYWIITDTQKRGVILCIPKTPHTLTPNEYQPLTLRNTNYKLLARLIFNRLRPWLPHILTENQYCGRQWNTIFDAVAMVRDAVAHGTATRTPLCVVPISKRLLTIYHVHIYSQSYRNMASMNNSNTD